MFIHLFNRNLLETCFSQVPILAKGSKQDSSIFICMKPPGWWGYGVGVPQATWPLTSVLPPLQEGLDSRWVLTASFMQPRLPYLCNVFVGPLHSFQTGLTSFFRVYRSTSRCRGVLAREGAGCGSVGDVPGAWLASAPLSPSLWT